MAVISIAGDDRVLVGIKRALHADRHRLLPDIEVAEAADQTHSIELPGPLLEAADQQHLFVEFGQFVQRRLVPVRFAGAFAVGGRMGRSGGR